MRVNVPTVRRATLLTAVLSATAVGAQTPPAGKITTPKEFFGFNIGDDWKLANYDQFQEYWKKIDAESDRMRVEEIGKTAEGRPQLMAIVTSPENFKKLDRFKEIAKKLALAEGLTDDEARALAREGKAVVWIDGGLHATEVLGAHQLIETSYQLVSRNDPETLRILNDDIMLLVHVNPDGMQLVSNWYMKDADTLKRNMNIPRLYQKYIGHDDNRDFYILNQPESQNIARIQYFEWFPQIVYNHHQTGPAGTVVFIDTSRVLHFGSRVATRDRYVVMVQYLALTNFMYNPFYSFKAWPYAHLARPGMSAAQRAVLGEAVVPVVGRARRALQRVDADHAS